MNGYELIMKIQERMKDPNFAQRFNKIVSDLNNIPGLQQEVMRISQIDDERARQKAVDKLPDRVKQSVKEFLTLLNWYIVLYYFRYEHRCLCSYFFIRKDSRY